MKNNSASEVSSIISNLAEIIIAEAKKLPKSEIRSLPLFGGDTIEIDEVKCVPLCKIVEHSDGINVKLSVEHPWRNKYSDSNTDTLAESCARTFDITDKAGFMDHLTYMTNYLTCLRYSKTYKSDELFHSESSKCCASDVATEMSKYLGSFDHINVTHPNCVVCHEETTRKIKCNHDLCLCCETKLRPITSDYDEDDVEEYQCPYCRQAI